MVTVSGLRNFSGDRAFVDLLWKTAQYGYSETGSVCGSCRKPMRRVTLPLAGMPLELDVCCSCQTVWFDSRELERSPLPEPEKTDELPQKARELLGFTAETSLDLILDEVIPWIETQIRNGEL